MCTCDYGEFPEFYVEKIVKARKEHKCCECGAKIEKGEHYHKLSGKWEGDIQTYKTCIFCNDVRQKAYSDFECIVFECLWETIGMDYAAEVKENGN